MTSHPAKHPVAALPWPANATQAPVRGQLAIVVLAAVAGSSPTRSPRRWPIPT